MHLASGNVPVSYETLPGGFAGTDATVARMRAAATGRYGSRSPKIRAMAINILRNAGVPEKNYETEAVALARWVQRNIRYTRDVAGQETLSYPEELLFNTRAGDCDDMSTLLAAFLGSVGIPSRFVTIGVTPLQFSHVYLQARPKNRWITMDTIMKQYPIGWEVPASRQAIRKEYPVNLPAGVNGMDGLGYVGDPRIESHVEAPFIPLDAGTGRQPMRNAARPAYVQMPSGLDTDAPVDALMAHPPNENVPRQYPQQRAVSTAPVQQRLTNQGVQPRGMDGYGVMTPDILAGMNGAVPPSNMSVAPYMQTKTVRQAPEGVDRLFGRASMVMDPRKGDKIDYYGYFDGQEKPPIRAYQNIAGDDASMPGMGYLAADGLAGPGLGDGATGNGSTSAPGPAPAPSVSNTAKFVGVAVAVAAGAMLLKAMRR